MFAFTANSFLWQLITTLIHNCSNSPAQPESLEHFKCNENPVCFSIYKPIHVSNSRMSNTWNSCFVLCSFSPMRKASPGGSFSDLVQLALVHTTTGAQGFTLKTVKFHTVWKTAFIYCEEPSAGSWTPGTVAHSRESETNWVPPNSETRS